DAEVIADGNVAEDGRAAGDVNAFAEFGCAAEEAVQLLLEFGRFGHVARWCFLRGNGNEKGLEEGGYGEVLAVACDSEKGVEILWRRDSFLRCGWSRQSGHSRPPTK